MDGYLRPHCQKCDEIFYLNPLPVVSTIVTNDRKEVLLVLRKKQPNKGMWCLPMGFVEIDETIETAALRELEEEAGIKGRIVRLLDAQTSHSSFYGNVIILCYEAEQVAGEIKAGDDAEDARFFPMNDLPELAFEANKKAIREYQEYCSGL